MAAELEKSTKLDAGTHISLEQPLLGVPSELIKRNIRTVQRYVTRDRESIIKDLKEAANASISSTKSPEETLGSLDSMIARMQNLKRRLQGMHDEDQMTHERTQKRFQHLQELYAMPTVADVKYDNWSRTRLDTLMVDYLFRAGLMESATSLAKEKQIEHLVDAKVFLQCQEVADCLERCETKQALQWCKANSTAAEKFDLEFMLRLQEYIELMRDGSPAKQYEAMQHAQKYLTPFYERHNDLIMNAAGLLAHGPDTDISPYKELLSPDTWPDLSKLFVKAYYTAYSLPTRPLLHIALTAGLSALKTPACHSAYPSSSANPHSTVSSVCPICSTELNELARNLPNAHHTKSHVEEEPLVLPNGRIYGRRRLEELQRKLEGGVGQVAEEEVRDPTTGEIYQWENVKKVYIS